MMLFWFVRDGNVEEYRGQETNWDNEVIVCATDPEDALIKVLLYYGKKLNRRECVFNGKLISLIS